MDMQFGQVWQDSDGERLMYVAENSGPWGGWHWFILREQEEPTGAPEDQQGSVSIRDTCCPGPGHASWEELA